MVVSREQKYMYVLYFKIIDKSKTFFIDDYKIHKKQKLLNDFVCL